MFWLTLTTLFNALANQQSVVNLLRFEFGGIALGINESLAFLLLAYALIFGGSIARAYPNSRVHPAFLTAIVVVTVSLIIGSINSAVNQVELGLYLRAIRELGTWPVFMIVGYRLLGSPKSAMYFVYLIIVAGFITALILLGHFNANTERVSGLNFNAVRSVSYMNAYAGMAAMVLAYSMISGDRLLPLVVALPLACLCLVGQCAPLHRGEWVSMMVCSVGLLTLVPRGRRVAVTIKGLAVLMALGVAITFAVSMASSVTERGDFGKYVQTRLISLLPIERQTTSESKAWDTRLDSTRAELELWSTNPLIGRGVAIQEELVQRGQMVNYGAFHHNGWASIMAQVGLLGMIGYALIPLSMLFMGRKLALGGSHVGIRMMGVLSFMSSLYMLVGITAGIMWSTRYAMFFGTVCGMVFRCRNMLTSTLADEYEAYGASGTLDQAHMLDDTDFSHFPADRPVSKDFA